MPHLFLGGGAYSFIPEATFVGTSFVNAMSSLLVTAVTNVEISMEASKGCKILSVLGSYESKEASWGNQVGMGSIQNGQPRTLVVSMDITQKDPSPYLIFSLKYVDKDGNLAQMECLEGKDFEGLRN